MFLYFKFGYGLLAYYGFQWLYMTSPCGLIFNQKTEQYGDSFEPLSLWMFWSLKVPSEKQPRLLSVSRHLSTTACVYVCVFFFVVVMRACVRSCTGSPIWMHTRTLHLALWAGVCSSFDPIKPQCTSSSGSSIGEINWKQLRGGHLLNVGLQRWKDLGETQDAFKAD